MKHYALVLILLGITASLGCSSGNSNVPVANTTNSNTNTNSEPLGTPTAGGGEDQASLASALVADLYKQHDAQKSPFFQTKDRPLVEKYFAKPLSDLIWKDANNASGEVGAIDGDPLYNAQDIEIKNFAIGSADVKGTAATVPVTFANFGEKRSVTFSLKQINGAWKIDDMRYGGGDSLMKWLRETYSDKTAAAKNGEFQGKFQVGDTTCTVKPVKMAFEVRWAKGSGVEMFFFKEGYVFESDDNGGPNRFEFDDANYTTGTFYRSDGKTFPVVRSR